jgi:hypothetical protein
MSTPEYTYGYPTNHRINRDSASSGVATLKRWWASPHGNRLTDRDLRRRAPNVLIPRARGIRWNSGRGDVQGLSPSKVRFNLLEDFVQCSQPWSRERARLPRRLRCILWALIPVQLIWGICLVTVLTEARPCGGPFCTVATLNRHPLVLLVCTVICVTVLAALVPFTQGLARCNGREVAATAVAAAAGGAALLGIATLIISAVIVLILLASFVLGFAATS